MLKCCMISLSLLALLTSCASLPPVGSLPVTSSLPVDTQSYLGDLLREKKTQHPDLSGFYLLHDGLGAFAARAALATAAEHTIDVQYYLFYPDLVGGLLGYTLLQAAERGVRVRILLDDIATAGRDFNLAVLDSHPNIEIRLFNPFVRFRLRLTQYLTRYGEVTRRMHNKTFTVDNQVTIVGGRNIGNHYFDADPDRAFGDLDVLAVGPVVQDVSGSFDKYWNSGIGYPIATLYPNLPAPDKLQKTRENLASLMTLPEAEAYVDAVKKTELIALMRANELSLFWGEATAYYDLPEKVSSALTERDLHLAPRLEPYMRSISNELIILSAYFVPGWEGARWLAELSKKGVRVVVLTNSLSSTDVWLVHAGYAQYRHKLLRAGVELYELRSDLQFNAKTGQKKRYGFSGASLHTKSFVLDREHLFVGSFNFDPRSYAQNTEIGIMFNSRDLGQQMGEQFDKIIADKAYRLELFTESDGTEIIRWIEQLKDGARIYYREPRVPFWKRLLVGFASLLPIEAEL